MKRLSLLLVMVVVSLTTKLAHAGSYTVFIQFTGCSSFCVGTTDYACRSGCGSGGFNTHTFLDQAPPGAVVTSVTAQMLGVYNSANISLMINGTAIGAPQTPPQVFSCVPSIAANFSASNGGGITGWVYGGLNAVTIGVPGNNICLNSVSLVVTHTEPVVISPSPASAAPRGAITFSASGGSGGAPYTFSLLTNASGGSITSDGSYQAGSTPSVIDVVKVLDSVNDSATINVAVGAGVSITGASSVTPLGSLTLAAHGGSGTGFAWSLQTNNSNGTIDAGTGVYTAGSIGNVSDVVLLTDSLGNTGSFSVSVGAGVSLSPTSPSSAPRDTLSFHAVGGSGSYTFTINPNNSGGTIASDGVYRAGATGSVSDTVRVVDSLGNSSSTTVTVGPVLTASPATPSIPPRGAIAFTISGGTGQGVVWALSPNNSGGSINAQTGSYVAGATGSVTDTVTVTDSVDNSFTIAISVGPGISPNVASTSSPPRGSASFSAAGGSGSGYTWSFSNNASSGSIDPATGAYQAGSTPNVTDMLLVTDSLGNTAAVSVGVTAGVSIDTSGLATQPNGTLTLSASGGSGTGWQWSLATNNSGGTVVAGSGVYTAGSTGTVSDTIQVVDSLGNSAQAHISVGNGVTINGTGSTPPRGSISLTAIGGSGTGYVWSISDDQSGGHIDASSGAYTAGATGSVTDVVSVTDSLGNHAQFDIVVGAALHITGGSSVAPRGALTFSVSGGSGASYVWSLSPNNSGGTIDSATGAYRAGAAGSTSDIIGVTDSLGNVATASVSVGAQVQLIAAHSSIPPRGTITFSATGGAGGYQYTFAANASNGSVDSSSGVYLAGTTSDVTDVVRVTDANGNQSDRSIHVGAALHITGAAAVAPRAGLTLATTGGSGEDIVWALSVNNSGASINAQTGQYSAGATGSVSDTISATDSLGNTEQVSVSVGGGVAVNPVAPTRPPRGSITFVASGGDGHFTWSFVANASGGTIATSGVYHAGATGSVTDIVSATDGVGNSARVSIAVGAGVTVTPEMNSVLTGDAIAFTVTGGDGSYAWSFVTNASGATIDADGHYVAGSIAGGDVIAATDGLGNSATVPITVTARIVIMPPVDAGTPRLDAEAGSPRPDGEAGGPRPAMADAGSPRPDADAGGSQPTVDAGSSEPSEGGGGSSSCSCSLIGSGRDDVGLLLLGFVGLVLAAARRRRRRA